MATKQIANSLPEKTFSAAIITHIKPAQIEIFSATFIYLFIYSFILISLQQN